MGYTTPSTRAPGYVVGATQWNELVNNDIWFAADGVAGKPICYAYRSSAQSIANNSNTAMSWNQNAVDNAGSHSTSINPSRLIAPVDGWYRLKANVVFAANATGVRIVSIIPNGTGVADSTVIGPSVALFDAGVMTESVMHLTAGMYAEVFAYQNSGGALNAQTISTAWFEWIAKH